MFLVFQSQRRGLRHREFSEKSPRAPRAEGLVDHGLPWVLRVGHGELGEALGAPPALQHLARLARKAWRARLGAQGLARKAWRARLGIGGRREASSMCSLLVYMLDPQCASLEKSTFGS